VKQFVVLAKGVSFVCQEAKGREIRYKGAMLSGLAGVAKATSRLRKSEAKNGM
jgi:hypothetical protein